MSFTQYKSLAEVLRHYRIKYIAEKFQVIKTAQINEAVRQDIYFTLREVAYDVSEAAICENLIYPILKDAWKNYADIFAIWSHQPIEYNQELSGIPDYVISKKSELGKIIFESPYIAVVEAKKDDFTGGWAQCSLEMYAIQEINQNANLAVYGIVSNGETWKIIRKYFYNV